MKIVVRILALAAIVSAPVTAQNYCDKSYCIDDYRSKIHIACGNNNQFAPECPKDAKMIDIDEKLKKVILTALNNKRNLIAGGGETGFKPACRMGTMQWNNELAELAVLNVKTCKVGHDCHRTNTYKESGQNISWDTQYGREMDLVTFLKNSIRDWYAEIKDFDMAGITILPPATPDRIIQHFVAMVQENSDRVGCAVSQFSENGGHKYLLTCNFATRSFIGETVYYDCNEPAKKCTTGTNADFPHLCSTNEKYKYNDPNWPGKMH